MTKKLFLFNHEFIELEPASDPRLDPSFPLTQEQYDSLTIDGLMTLLNEEFQSNPQLNKTNLKMLRYICALLNQVGRINCVRIGGSGHQISSQHGIVAESTLAQLRALQLAGQLRDADTDEMIWSKMPAA